VILEKLQSLGFNQCKMWFVFVIVCREDFDSSLKTCWGSLCWSYQIACPCRRGQKYYLFELSLYICPCFGFFTKIDVVCKAFTSCCLVLINMFELVYVWAGTCMWQHVYSLSLLVFIPYNLHNLKIKWHRIWQQTFYVQFYVMIKLKPL
jgi:hypothetical protein